MFHGNWCGPYWSNGEMQSSVLGYAPPVDEFDVTCRDHDFVYASAGNLSVADRRFFSDNFGKSLIRSAAAIAVGAQSLFRDLVPGNKILFPQMSKKNLRAATGKKFCNG